MSDLATTLPATLTSHSSTFTLPFTKMQGAGNDVIVLNAMQGLPALSAVHFRHLGDRRYGIGCDQILIVAPPKDVANDFSYRIVNQDGSEVEHCGNGARCFMRFVRDEGLTTKKIVRVEIATGVIVLTEFDDGEVEVNMGAPRFEPESLPFLPMGLTTHPLANGFVTFQLPNVIDAGNKAHPVLDRVFGTVSMGNPHAVQVVDDVDTAPVTTQGPLIENHTAFPNRVNAGFIQVINPHHIKLRVWERGAGETLACGTGACAAVVVGIQMGVLQSPVQVQARGGVLNIAWGGKTGDGYADVLMRGPAVSVYRGSIELKL
jgi:diaminopimelate epimerase